MFQIKVTRDHFKVCFHRLSSLKITYSIVILNLSTIEFNISSTQLRNEQSLSSTFQVSWTWHVCSSYVIQQLNIVNIEMYCSCLNIYLFPLKSIDQVTLLATDASTNLHKSIQTQLLNNRNFSHRFAFNEVRRSTRYSSMESNVSNVHIQ